MRRSSLCFLLLQELSQWFELLKLVKVKSHAGCQLNEMADEQAEMGCAFADEPAFPRQKNYGSLLLPVLASTRTLRKLATNYQETGHPIKL